jgi:hypothetical protein
MAIADSTQVLKMLVDLTKALPHKTLFSVGVALDELSQDDLQELNEAVRLVKGFINNV